MGIWGHEPVSFSGYFTSAITFKGQARKIEKEKIKWQIFLVNWEKRFRSTASDFSKKAEDTLEIQKLKSDIRSMKRSNERDFKDIGRMVYEKFRKGEVDDTEYISLCEEIEKREEEIEKQEEQIVKIKEEI